MLNLNLSTKVKAKQEINFWRRKKALIVDPFKANSNVKVVLREDSHRLVVHHKRNILLILIISMLGVRYQIWRRVESCRMRATKNTDVLTLSTWERWATLNSEPFSKDTSPTRDILEFSSSTQACVSHSIIHTAHQVETKCSYTKTETANSWWKAVGKSQRPRQSPR